LQLVLIAAGALVLTSCSTYTKSAYNCDHIKCDTVAACTDAGQRELDTGNSRDGACYFYRALEHDANADEARMGYAFSLLLVGRPDAAGPEFERVRSHTANAELRDTAAQYLELLQTKIPVSVLYHDAVSCSSEILRDGEIAGKNFYRLVADLGLFEVKTPRPIHIDWQWRCCDSRNGAAVALVLTPTCEGYTDERHDLRAGNIVYGQSVMRRYNGAVRVELFETQTATRLKVFNAHAQTLAVLGGDTTFLSFGKAEGSLISDIVRTILNQR
jgi:hypothetical protein